MSTSSSCQPQVHVYLKFMSACITSRFIVEGIYQCSCQPQVQHQFHFSLFMSTSSSCQPVLQVDLLFKVHCNVLVNLKFSISFISAYSCKPQVNVNIWLMLSCICISTPHMHVYTKFACNVAPLILYKNRNKRY